MMLQSLRQALDAGKSGVHFKSKSESSSSSLMVADFEGEQPPSLWGHTAFHQEDGKVIIHGGQGSAGGPVGSVWCLDAAGKCEEMVGSSTEPLQFHGCVSIPDMSLTLAFGGEGLVDGTLQELDSTQCFDTSLDLWYPAATTGTAPTARSGHAMACIKQDGDVDLNQSGESTGTQSMLRRVMQASGLSASASSSLGATPSSQPSTTPASMGSAASACGEIVLTTPTVHDAAAVQPSADATGGAAVLVHGGVRQGRFVNDVHVMDMNTYRWSKSRPTGSPPGPRAYHTLTPIGGGRVVLVGGSDDRQAFGDVHVLDTACHPWAWSEPCTSGLHPTPRSGHIALRVSPRHILVAGGWNPHGSAPCPLGDAYLLDVETWQWNPVTPALMPTTVLAIPSTAAVSPAGGSKRAADGPLPAVASASKRRGTRAVTGTVEQVVTDVDFGVWQHVARVGASAVLLGAETSCQPAACGILLHGGRDVDGVAMADIFLIPLPISALQSRARSDK